MVKPMRKKPKSRTCCACRTVSDKENMLRVVKNPDGSISYDKDHTLSGRGAYICKSERCILKAAKSRCLDRSLKTQVPHGIYEMLKEAISDGR